MLLPRNRRPRLRSRSVNQVDGARAPLLQEHNVPADDPDDSMDPDDSGPRLSVSLKQSPNGGTDAYPVAQAAQTSGRCPDTGDGSKGPQSPPRAPPAATGTPTRPDLLDPVILRTLPPRVAAFMLYEPREPPPWRRQETLVQRAHREMIEDCGSWVGE